MQQQSIDVLSIIALLNSQSSESKLDGLTRLEGALLASYPQNFACRPEYQQHLSPLFQALKTCLTVSEADVDILLRANAILYEMMPDIVKYPTELQPEMSALIPIFIENLGNSKATVRKSTHKCIGTFVKFSKRLESVLLTIIKHGISNPNSQRTRQHSMLVIPALISLKPQVIEEGVIEIKLLVQEIIIRLRDPADVVAKTARKLLLELHKCYVGVFEAKYISSLTNANDKAVCHLILQEKFEEATQILANQSLQVSGAQIQTQPSQMSQYSHMASQVIAASRQKSKSPPKQIPQVIQQSSQQILVPPKQDNGSQMLPAAQTQQIAAYGKSLGPVSQQILKPDLSHQISAQPLPAKSSFLTQTQNKDAKSPRQGIQQLRDLSIVGREIIGSQTMQKAPPKATDSLEAKSLQVLLKNSTQSNRPTPQSQAPLILPQEEPLVIFTELKKDFGFLDPSLVKALNENNFWSERTKAMEQIEALVGQISIGSGGRDFELTTDEASDFLQFVVSLIPDINFKISLASIKLVTHMLRKNMMQNKKHYSLLVVNLTEKLSDSKQVVRDATLECCALVIVTFRQAPFLAHCAKSMQHANWHVREGILILIARCLIESESSGLIIQNDLIEELCFCVKVEDKAALQRMAIDNLALALSLSKNQSDLSQQIERELGVKKSEESKEQQSLEQILYRLSQQAFPCINSQDRVEFKLWRVKQEDEITQAYEKLKQKKQSMDLTPAMTKSPFPGLNKPNKTVEIDPQESFKVRVDDDMRSFQQEIRSVIPDFEKLQMDDAQLYPHSATIKKGPGSLIQTLHLNNPDPNSAFSQIIRPPALAKQTSQHSQQQDQKIAMWLPNFNNPSQNDTDSASAVRRINSRISDSVDMLSGNAADDLKRINSRQSENSAQAMNQTKHGLFGQNLINNKSQRGVDSVSVQNNTYQQDFNLNVTSSSLATYAEESRTTVTKAHNPFDGQASTSAQNFKGPVQRTAIFGDGSKIAPSYETQETFRQAFGQSQTSTNLANNFIPAQNQTNYTPIQHKGAPRTIQSTQDKSNYQQSNSDNQETVETGTSQSYHNGTTDQKQLNDRLTLLKSSYKYKNKNSNSSNNMQAFRDLSETADQIGYNLEEGSHPNTLYENNKRGGPVRAAHIKVSEETKLSGSGKKTPGSTQIQSSQVQLKTRQAVSANKPPTNQTGGRIQNQSHTAAFESPFNNEFDNHQVRSNSIELQRQNFNIVSQSEKKPKLLEAGMPPSADMVGASYDLVTEPLQNPQSQITTAIIDLKSSDWSKQFEACNTIRRAAMFHKQIIQQNLTVFKELVKPVESLRSQVSKNACLAMQELFSNLSAGLTDSQIDNVLPTLLKRAADTNQFISEQACQTLVIMVSNCTETKVFSQLQAQTLKTTGAKEKVCYCYTLLVERLIQGGKLKTFQQIDRLVQTIVASLSESAAEVRQQAKLGVHTVYNGCSGQREFDQLLMQCRLNEKQTEQIRKVLKQDSFESLTQYANTRYGNLKQSPLQGAVVFKAEGNSDGFTRRSTGGAASQLTTTLMSGNGNQSKVQREAQQIYGGNQATHNLSSGFDNTQSTFKMRTTSVSKPVDRQLMDNFKALIDTANTQDWQKRVQAIDTIQSFSVENAHKIKQNQSSFIGLVDAYSRLLQDNNAKVLARSQQSFAVILQTPDLQALVNQNLTMIIQAITTNLCSTMPQVRVEGQNLMDLLEQSCYGEARNVNALVQPIISQVNLTNCRAKAVLIERLAGKRLFQFVQEWLSEQTNPRCWSVMCCHFCKRVTKYNKKLTGTNNQSKPSSTWKWSCNPHLKCTSEGCGMRFRGRAFPQY